LQLSQVQDKKEITRRENYKPHGRGKKCFLITGPMKDMLVTMQEGKGYPSALNSWGFFLCPYLITGYQPNIWPVNRMIMIIHQTLKPLTRISCC